MHCVSRRFALVGKYPPIEGGVSADNFWLVQALADAGHGVSVITNADEVSPGYRAAFLAGDETYERLENVDRFSTVPVPEMAFIPWAEPFAVKLFGLTLSVLDGRRHDAILGSYLEPYGVVATLAGKARGIPVFLRTAGSDVGRLSRHENLHPAYQWALAECDGLIAPDPREVAKRFDLSQTRRVTFVRRRLPRVYFGPAPSFDLAGCSRLAEKWGEQVGMPTRHLKWLRAQARRDVPKGRFTLGTYGKIGAAKGSFDLLHALELAAGEGADFHLIALLAGNQAQLADYFDYVIGSPVLRSRMHLLPALAPWRIPGFIGKCDAVAFLERDFSIDFHSPCVPREVLAGGAALLTSGEIAANEDGRRGLVSHRNCFVVADPRDHSNLARCLVTMCTDSNLVAAVRYQGRMVSNVWEGCLPTWETAVASLVGRIEEILGPPDPPGRH
jgi:Glycosyl transferase 4-like domain